MAHLHTNREMHSEKRVTCAIIIRLKNEMCFKFAVSRAINIDIFQSFENRSPAITRFVFAIVFSLLLSFILGIV